MKLTWTVIWIDSVDQFPLMLEEMKDDLILALDTETYDWQIGNEKLGLIQIGVPSKKLAYLIDVLAVKDISILAPLFEARIPEKIVHNGQFEERQLGRFGIKLRGIVDTVTKAREFRPDLPNHKLSTCAKYLLGEDLSKTEQVSDWQIRPLTPQQIEYAALDVEVAMAVYLSLRAIEDRLEINAELPVENLMRELSEISSVRYEMTKEIAAELAFLDVRFERIKELIKQKLLGGEDPYHGPFGSCEVQKIKRTEVSPIKLRSVFPDLAPVVITEKVERKRLEAVMKEYGVDLSRIDEVLDVIGYADRLKLVVG